MKIKLLQPVMWEGQRRMPGTEIDTNDVIGCQLVAIKAAEPTPPEDNQESANMHSPEGPVPVAPVDGSEGGAQSRHRRRDKRVGG